MKSVPGYDIFFNNNNLIQLKTYSNSDSATYHETRKFITSFSIYIGYSLMSWNSKKQQIISRSSLEDEYRAPAGTTCEIQWIIYLLEDLHIRYTNPTLLYYDN